MHYRDALQLVLGEATRLHEEGTVSEPEFRDLLADVAAIDRTLSNGSSQSRRDTVDD